MILIDDQLWSKLPIHSFIDGIIWYEISVFIDFLKSHQDENDDRRLYQANFLQTFCRKNNSLKEIGDVALLSLEGLLGVCIDTQKRHSVCKKLQMKLLVV